jgi:hypothetical protein
MGSFSEDSSEKNKLIIDIWAGVSSNDALSSPARTKRLLRRLDRILSGDVITIKLAGGGKHGCIAKMQNTNLPWRILLTT